LSIDIIERYREKADLVPSAIRHSDDDKWKSTESLPIVKTFRLSVNPSDDDDLSASHPNVCLAVTRRNTTKSPPTLGHQSAESSVFEEPDRRSMNIVVRIDDTVGEGIRQALADEHSAMTLPKRAMSSDRGHALLERSPVLGRDRRCSSSSSSSERRSLSDSADDFPVARERNSWMSNTNKLFDVGRSLEHQEVFISETTDRDDEFKTAEDLALDIDSALAEVMSGIESLGLGHVLSRDQDVVKVVVPEIKKCSLSPQRAKSSGTPDLVIGLPVVASAQQHSPKGPTTAEQTESSSTTSSVPLTNAEVFANVNQSTIKKGTCSSVSSTGSSSDRYAETGSMQTFSRKTVAKVLSTKDTQDTVDGNNRSAEDVGPKSPIIVGETAPSVFEPMTSSPVSGGVPPGKSKPSARRPEPAPRKDLPKSSEIEFVRSIVLPFDDSGTCVRSLSLARDGSLDVSSSKADAIAVLRPLSAAVGGSATLPRSLSTPASSVEVRIAPRLGTSPADTPVTSTAVKPPVKVKPPVMKKPARTGDMIKRLQDSLNQQGSGQPLGISVTTSQQ